MQDIKPVNTGTRSLGQVFRLKAGTEGRDENRPRRFGGGFYAEADPDCKVCRSTFTPGPIVDDKETF
jgi:hypothetical protein